jgi:hypothetical protein
MPLLDWQAGSRRGLVGPGFWVYFALTIPHTALILGEWAVWIRVIS